MKALGRGRMGVLCVLCAALISGCQKPEDTVESLQNKLSLYAAQPSEEASAEIDGLFARLESQIEKLRVSGQSAEADSLTKQRDALQAQYAAARMTASLLKAKEAAVGVGEAFRRAGEAFGQALRSGSGESE